MEKLQVVVKEPFSYKSWANNSILKHQNWVVILKVDQNDSAEKEQNDINFSNLSLFVPSWLTFQTKFAP